MQEQMQRLQQQLEASQNLSTSSGTPVKTTKNSIGPKLIQDKTAAATKKTNTHAGKHFTSQNIKRHLLQMEFNLVKIDLSRLSTLSRKVRV